MLVVTVLRTMRMLSCDFSPRIVQAVKRMVDDWAPRGTDFLCVTDVPVPGVNTLPLLHKWPGWYAKLEMYDPRIVGDFLYIDLDMPIVGPLEPFLRPRTFTGMYDAKPGQFGSQLMYVPVSVRSGIWKDWIKDPWGHIQHYNQPGRRWDSGFAEKHVGLSAKHWETELPGLIQNRKDVLHCGLNSSTCIVNCTSRPRPWQMPQFRKLYQ